MGLACSAHKIGGVRERERGTINLHKTLVGKLEIEEAHGGN
jgi:hypothetical protein